MAIAVRHFGLKLFTTDYLKCIQLEQYTTCYKYWQ